MTTKPSAKPHNTPSHAEHAQAEQPTILRKRTPPKIQPNAKTLSSEQYEYLRKRAVRRLSFASAFSIITVILITSNWPTEKARTTQLNTDIRWEIHTANGILRIGGCEDEKPNAASQWLAESLWRVRAKVAQTRNQPIPPHPDQVTAATLANCTP